MSLDFSQSWPYFLILILLIPIGLAWRSFAPWLPAHQRDLKRIIDLANLKPGEVFIDLGCGDGRVVQEIAKQTPATAIGVELAWPWVFYCKTKQFFSRTPHLTFIWKDLFQVDVSKADVIYLFGTPKTLQGKLKTKLKRESKPSARVISYCFSVEGWQPSLVDQPSKQLPIYLYEISSQAE